jgi:multidrug resistance efflux pump
MKEYKAKNSEIEIRSDEVQEILSHVPNWMIRWGISLIFGVILMLLLLSWFIKYPDAIPAEVTLSTANPPIRLVAKTSGQLKRISVQEGEFVNQGDFIAQIENPLGEDAVLFLDAQLETLIGYIDSKKLVYFQWIESPFVLGELQQEYNQLRASLQDYIQLMTDEYLSQRIDNLKKQIDFHSKLVAITNKQIGLADKEMKNTRAKFESDKVLFERGVISKVDLMKEESLVNQSEQSLESLRKTYVQHQITLTDYERQLQELKYDFSEKERILFASIQSSIKNLKNYIRSWEQNFVLTAPHSGIVSYLGNWSENQFIQSGTSLFAVVPEHSEYIGFVQISAQGYGKIKSGQRVNIQLANYPSHEFGQLVGTVSQISQIPSQGSENGAEYLLHVKLDNGMVSTYKKELEFKPEMRGTAEIITEDLRLIERVFNQFRKMFDR